MEIAKLIKTNRKKRGLSRPQLASKANVSVDALYAWETGKRKPTIECADRVLKALDISIELGKTK